MIDADGSLTGYLYDGAQCISEYNEDGKVEVHYVHGVGLGADVGSLLFSETTSDTRYYYYNCRGDVSDVLSSQGAMYYRYSGFGQIIEQSEIAENEFQFSSKRINPDTGLSYFGARYYDPLTGRFISRDPMGFIDGPNGYIYVANNPFQYIDPFGLNARSTSSDFLSNALSTDPIRFTNTGYIPTKPPNVIQVGLSKSAGAGKGVTVDGGYIFGVTPEEGFIAKKYISAGGGLVEGASVSFVGEVTFWSDINSVYDLEGGGYEFGGTVNIPQLPFSTFGVSGLLTDSRPEALGTKLIGGGATGTPITGHQYRTITKIID
ncbi:MAG: RHS repeat-associated core domain-containing protein [bacterium]|nr:RHS repeat-associated core domain-containing protein [bacterium]